MAGHKKKAVFLDRDGVINAIVSRGGKLSVPFSVNEFKVIEGAREAVALLKAHGFVCIVVTNQPDIARGNLSEKNLSAIHKYMQKETGVEAVYFCPHSKDGECNCKKPAMGMVQDAVREHGIVLAESWLVGDRWRDIQMAKNAGLKSILVVTDATKEDVVPMEPDYSVKNLSEAARIIAGA